ncbi:hypothetical protein ABZ725_26255 [Streptomyces sp. NPDC006872]|uniref:hypothetical protein n=1 Tax=Streptomyces sp. NPDC006872 TaxID=3155720 RepID=UPI0033ED91C5
MVRAADLDYAPRYDLRSRGHVGVGGAAMLVELLIGAAVGFLGGLTTAWRIVAKGAAQAWLDDLRDQVLVRKADRRKNQAIRHAKLDWELSAESEAAQAKQKQAAAAVEAERRRVRRAHSELKKALPLANEAVRTHTNETFVGALEYTARSWPDVAVEAATERDKLTKHRAVMEQLRGQVEKLASLGVDLKCPIKDWSQALSTDLRTLADEIDKAAKAYALKV